MKTTKRIITVAWVELVPDITARWKPGKGRPMRAEGRAVVWLLRGTEADSKKALAHAETIPDGDRIPFATALSFPRDEKNPLTMARTYVVATYLIAHPEARDSLSR